MDYWPLKPEARETPIGLSQATALLARVGQLQPGALAGALLNILGEHVALAQCVVFAYPPEQTPRLVSYADRARTRELPAISREYAERFFLEDTNRLAMHELMASRRRQSGDRTDAGAGRLDDAILVHRQLPEDITHADYRAICYDQPRISDRIALLTHQDPLAWLSINLYRGREHGRFSTEEIQCIESFAPFLTQLARLHLPADRLPVLRQRLQRLVDAFGALGELPLPNADQQGGQPVEPQAALLLRPDVPLPPLSPEQALANAPQQAAGAFLVPRVVDA